MGNGERWTSCLGVVWVLFERVFDDNFRDRRKSLPVGKARLYRPTVETQSHFHTHTHKKKKNRKKYRYIEGSTR